MNFQPMLSGELDLRTIKYPCLLSPKLDGVRAMIYRGILVSRNLKPLPNLQLQLMARVAGEGFDGELIVGNPMAPDVFRKTMSTVMSAQSDPSLVRLFVFDSFKEPNLPYKDRVREFEWMTRSNFVIPVTQVWCENESDLLKYEAFCISNGYEGIMVRDPMAPYKFGRSTTKEGFLLKFKRFQDGEARVVGFEELHHNDNPQTRDAMGYAERSSHKVNMRPAGVLGALVVDWKGKELRIGTGFDQQLRKDIWTRQDDYKNLWVKFKYLSVGMKDLPRHPTFLGFIEQP